MVPFCETGYNLRYILLLLTGNDSEGSSLTTNYFPLASTLHRMVFTMKENDIPAETIKNFYEDFKPIIFVDDFKEEGFILNESASEDEITGYFKRILKHYLKENYTTGPILNGEIKTIESTVDIKAYEEISYGFNFSRINRFSKVAEVIGEENAKEIRKMIVLPRTRVFIYAEDIFKPDMLDMLIKQIISLIAIKMFVSYVELMPKLKEAIFYYSEGFKEPTKETIDEQITELLRELWPIEEEPIEELEMTTEPLVKAKDIEKKTKKDNKKGK